MSLKNCSTPELLAPCGSPDALSAAIAAGADAVYFGGRMRNARMNAKNFDDAAVAEGIQACHRSGLRAYVTLNTLVLDKEMEEAVRYAAWLYEAGADALIVADMGLALLLSQYIPALALHASTQASGHSAGAAVRLRELGFTRMVCARELSARDIRTLTDASPIEIEMFIHGALCVSHSGQCLLSSVIGGRSGNRGECAQPCRMAYQRGAYPLSLRDLCLAGHMTEVLECGAASLKIEGRMKSPEYVYGVVSMYRRLIDERRNAFPAEIKQLAELFARGGFTDGYFRGELSTSMLGVRSEGDKKLTRAVKMEIKPIERRLPPIETEPRRVVLPPKLRRLQAGGRAERGISARFQYAKQIPENASLEHIYLPLDRYEGSAADGVLLPSVIKDSEAETVRRLLAAAYEKGARHALVGNIGHIRLAEEMGFAVHGDSRLNVCNSAAAYYYGALTDILLSPELTLPQIRDIPARKSVVVYGKLPVMLLEKPLGLSSLRDRTGAVFPVIAEEMAVRRDVLYNSVPVYMADKTAALEKAGVINWHFIFTTETKKECAAVLEAYQNRRPPDAAHIRRIKL